MHVLFEVPEYLLLRADVIARTFQLGYPPYVNMHEALDEPLTGLMSSPARQDISTLPHSK